MLPTYQGISKKVEGDGITCAFVDQLNDATLKNNKMDQAFNWLTTAYVAPSPSHCKQIAQNVPAKFKGPKDLKNLYLV